MKTQIIILFIAAGAITAAGCRADMNASADPAAEAGHAHEAHAANAPTDPIPATVTGMVSGFDCAVVGELCPTTHRGGDYTTGVFTEGDEFYFVVNIPQSFMSQYFLETMEVEGRSYPPYEHAVEPEVIHLVDGDERTLVYESGYFIDEEGDRATFHEGRYENGRWMVP